MLNRLFRPRCVASTPKSGLVPEVTGSGNRFHIWSLCCRLPLLPAFLHIFFLKCGNGAELEYLSLPSKSIPSSLANARRQNASVAHFTNRQPALKKRISPTKQNTQWCKYGAGVQLWGENHFSFSPSALDGELFPPPPAPYPPPAAAAAASGRAAVVLSSASGKPRKVWRPGTVFYLLFWLEPSSHTHTEGG